jgi:aspartyl protease/PDZ domain-containing protein
MKSKIAVSTCLVGAFLLNFPGCFSLHASALESQADAGAKPKQQSGTKASSTVPGPKGLRIPFELVGNIICLKVRVNGSEPLSFVLDTGASATILDSDQADRLGLQPEKYPLTIAGAPADIRRVRGVSLSLPGLDLVDQTPAVFHLDTNQLIHSGRHLDGLLGYSFFSQFVVEIDYVARVITLYDPKTFQYTGPGDIIPITVSRVPFVNVKITTSGTDTTERLVMIDSGSHSSLNYVAEQFPPGTIEQDVLDMTDQVTKSVQATFGRAESLQLGRFTVNNPVVGLTHSFAIPGLSSSMNGLIGGGILRRFKVTFDYSQNRMILEPNKHFGDPLEFDMSGAFLISDLPKSNGFKVFSVMPKTPASEAGLREGDVIVAINAEPAEKFDLAKLQYDLFVQTGRTYRLTVRRQDERVQVRIKLRKLI